MLQIDKFLAKAAVYFVLIFTFCQSGIAQTENGQVQTKKPSADLPTVTRVDIEGLRKLIKPNGKPLLINFWATWCDPCREEFPDLVKLDAAYKGKIDFITVSLDELSDLKTYVPQFLAEVNAEMPAYLLKTPDDNAAITMVSKDWTGNLPFTILFTPSGDIAYLRKGKIRYASAVIEIDKVLSPPARAANAQ